MSSLILLPRQRALLEALRALAPDDSSFYPARPRLLSVCLLRPPFVDLDVSSIASPLDIGLAPFWNPTRCTISTGHADPDGGANACGIVESGDLATTHYDYQRIVDGMNAACGPASFPVYLKIGSRGHALAASDASTGTVWDLTTGLVTENAGGATSGNLAAAAGGWWRGLYVPNKTLTASTVFLSFYVCSGPTFASRVCNGVLGQTAYYVYNPGIIQTSISRAQNLFSGVTQRPTADGGWGDPLHWGNTTKSAQLVLAPNWAGRDCGVLSLYNWLEGDEIAPLLAGSDTRFTSIIAHTTSLTSATAAVLLGLCSSTDDDQVDYVGRASAVQRTYRRGDDAVPVTADSSIAYVLNQRIVRASVFDGTTRREYCNGVASATNPISQNTDALTGTDRLTFGCQRYLTVPTGGAMWSGLGAAFVVMLGALSDADVIRASRLLMAHVGGI